MLLKRGYYYLTVKRCMYVETIGLFPVLVSSSKAKRRRKQEESVQRFNRISCTERATPRPQLSLISFALFSSVSLCFYATGYCRREENVLVWWMGSLGISGSTGDILWLTGLLVFKIISTGEQDRDYCHCSVQLNKLWLVESKTI